MTGGETPPRKPQRKPTFFWQGTFILLPAMLLSVTGLQSLKQDRVLAEHQALEQATALAKTISERLPRDVLRPPPPPEPSLFTQASAGQLEPESDPVMQATHAAPGSLAFLLGRDGALLYPRPWPALPSPEPLDTSSLDDVQQTHWSDFEGALAESKITSRHALPLEALLATRLPPRLAALAQYRAAVACEHAHSEKSARDLFASLAETSGAIRAENGFPLSLFARVHLLMNEGSGPANMRRKSLNELCGSAVATPTLLTSHVLHWGESFDEDLPRRWKGVLALHDQCRTAAEQLVAAGRPDRIELSQGSYYVFVQPLADSQWVVALPHSLLANSSAQLLATLAIPDQFAAVVSLAGAQLYPVGSQDKEAEALATKSTNIALDHSTAPLLARIYLADPEKFYAAQRGRTFRFALLIGLSGVAVFIGFLNAWRAFLREQRLNEMKTNFVSSVSHELRAPIASVRLMAQELEENSPPDKLRSYLSFIIQESLRLSAVIENVLDFSRREQGRDHFSFESTDFVRLVKETASLMQSYADRSHLTVDVEVSGDPYDVEADGAALQRLLVNLIDNAIKHSPENAIVRIGLEFHACQTLLWVEDSGPGIPKDEQDRIFERFYRIGSELRRNTQGVGLGLSIVKYIAEAHGGAVRVRSEIGQGSRFTLDLPRTRPLPNLSSHEHEQPHTDH